MTKLVDSMKETVEQWQDEKEDAAGGQVQGLFWYYLAQDMADKGGVGLWKDLYRFFTDMQKTNATSQSLDEGL
jgi:Rod binding domain-containing protein